MSVYTPGIPTNVQLLNVSQPLIKTNFTELNNQFGVEHTPYNNNGSNGDGLHKQVTLPNVTVPSPTPLAANGTIYGSKTGTEGGNITEAVFISGDAASATNVAILSAIKAWGFFQGTTKQDGFNFSSVTNPVTGTYNITFINVLPSANYCVLVMGDMASTFSAGAIIGTASQTTTGFQINCRALTGAFGTNVGNLGFVVLQS